MQFSIKPAQIENEAPIGYLLRLITRNGLTRTSALVSDAQLNRVIKCIDSNVPEIDLLLPKRTHLSSMQSPLFNYSLQLTPKICPDCIREKPYYRNEWQNPFQSYCAIHGNDLISVCSHCNSLLKFEPTLLQARCTNVFCHKALTAERNKHLHLSHEQVSDVLLAAHHYEKIGPIKSTKYPQLPNFQYALKLGYALLTDLDCAKKWAKQSIHSISGYYTKSIANVEIIRLLSHLKTSWPAVKTLKKETEQCHIRCLSNVSEVWLSASEACKSIGITIEGLTTLASEGLIRTQTNARLSNKSVVDVSPLFLMISLTKPSTKMEPMSSFKALLLKNDIEMQDVVIALYKGELAYGYQPGKTLLDSIYCDSKTLHRFAKKHFDGIKKRMVDIDKAIRITGASREEILAFRKSGKARIPRWAGYNSDELVDYNDVLNIRKLKNQLSLEF
ncbi:TniQ family protein [Shewanella electrodiphila]|uniref:TniQ family protein n=1 Tax=Shewanella electrodiphila TaxID=934143 RepID=A0ABT0KMJ6_9GAMM|nr:TniQ family protein [Shewanella electrodiphila]MCL1044934.1 TniQ family protein [Shewanella electrodiphila]